MTKKKTKKVTINNNQTRDGYTVVLEDIRSQFKVFGEVLGDVKEIVSGHTIRLDNVENRLDNVENDMGIVKNKLENVENDMGIVKNKLENVENDMGIVKNKLENVENDMGIVKKELSIVRHNQITRDEFKLLETRVDRLERITKK